MEAIQAPDAWEYKDKLIETVNIGIIDDMFDLSHEDVQFAEAPLGNETALTAVQNGKIKWSNHGTHVAGIAAATFDNNKGIAGASIKANLYGASWQGMNFLREDATLQMLKIMFYYLIVCKQCSVINMSLGYNELAFNASRNNAFALNNLEYYSKNISRFLRLMIDDGYQFILCVSSGNQNQVNGGTDYKYFLKDSYDDNREYKYYPYQSYKDYLDGKEIDDKSKQFFSKYKKYLEIRVEDGGRLDDGNVDAKYDIFGAITDSEVKNRIIIVGAAENLGVHREGFLGLFGEKVHNGYTIAQYSQGGKRVDVIAPGVNIYSTIKNGYGYNGGTSMASPHVAGVAGLLFSANPTLNGDVVKKIICESSIGSYGNEGYGLLNAKNAVETALSYSDSRFNQFDIPSGAAKFNNHYYYIYDFPDLPFADQYTWENALAYCQGVNGYLATITSPEENEFVYSYMKEQGYESAYFGLSDSDVEGTWAWCNGEALSYTNWAAGEPTGGLEENYGMFYYKYPDKRWSDGDFKDIVTDNGGRAFICEWGEYSVEPNSQSKEPVRTTSDERDIVLVLDSSGSMSGTPMEETKKAATNFVNTILEEDASIGIVTYDNSASTLSDFSVNKTMLTEVISSIWDGGGTNIEAGLAKAHSMLNTSGAKKKIIVLMSDGEPNDGKEGDALISYADEIKNDGIIIYTLGFFENMHGNKSSAQYLMEHLASDGCHYEVASADDLVFFFEDMADQINGQKYIYIRIACPVDVTVTYNGETLCSAEDDLNVRTDFGTLTFEDSENETSANEDDRIKVLRLKEGADYDVQIVGTGRGMMDYTIGFMDESGEYSDFRRFEDVKITKKTVIDTVAAVSSESVLNIDEDGDGKYDLKLRAEENGYGEEIKHVAWLYYAIGGTILIILLLIYIKIITHKKKRGTVA